MILQVCEPGECKVHTMGKRRIEKVRECGTIDEVVRKSNGPVVGDADWEASVELLRHDRQNSFIVRIVRVCGIHVTWQKL